jgi:multiple sugar transport system substrate-binding protein
MTRPQSEAEYLARLVPSSVAATSMRRRSVLAGGLGLGAALGGSALLAACGGSDSGGSGGSASSATGELTFGSNASDAKPKATLQTVLTSFEKANPGLKVKVNTVDHNTFQEQINNYLQGKPDDVFTWFAGYRMQFFASQGLVGDLSDVWGNLSGYSDALKKASTGEDGKQYIVPGTYYPWAVFYRKSVWQKYGYEVPKNLDEFKMLAQKMQKDGLIPIAFADKDGWPAMGTFDVLNMRINGYQYHVDLMAHKKPWTDPGVKKVFDTWKDLLPLHQQGALGRTWQEAATGLQQKKAGMYLLGLFVSQQFAAADQADLDFFTFPAVDPSIGADAIDAPIDGYMLSAKPKNEGAAKKLLQYIGSPDFGTVYAKADQTTLVANTKSDTTPYTALQKKAAQLVGSAKNYAQFLDRDTRPDFASTVMIPALQTFIKNPNDVDGLTNSIENQAKSIFTS